MFDRAYRITAAPGAEERLIAELRTSARASRSEPGVLFFEVFRSATDPRAALVVERYASEDAYDAHRMTAHFAAWRTAATGIVEVMEPFTGVEP